MTREASAPCQSDLACFRNDGHTGNHAYPLDTTLPQPVRRKRNAMSGDYFNTPIISVELQSMKLSLKHAIAERSLMLDGWITAEIDKALSEENVKFIIEQQVKRVIESVVNEEVNDFYRRGDGRAIIQKVINERLAP